ncbi:hypothetical protein MNBD_DELTA02-1003 [hydrothermal vent metagenome]|uniref:Uncharacterized protein n=1 Tax=hydrothermal vent metagenome TaxID=652676 RepID=A0A3B0V940_9ZZZZ
MKRPRFAIGWFAFWGIFQAFAVAMVLLGRWKRPEAFPEEAYNSLVWPDLFFIPLYLATAVLLFKRRKEGRVLGVFSGGAVSYVMVYLIALSGLEGIVNLAFDGVFLGLNLAATFQVARLLI